MRLFWYWQFRHYIVNAPVDLQTTLAMFWGNSFSFSTLSFTVTLQYVMAKYNVNNRKDGGKHWSQFWVNVRFWMQNVDTTSTGSGSLAISQLCLIKVKFGWSNTCGQIKESSKRVLLRVINQSCGIIKMRFICKAITDPDCDKNLSTVWYCLCSVSLLA